MLQRTRAPAPVKPARSAKPRPKRKPAPPVRAEWISRLGHDGTGIALIGRGDDLQPYPITENVATLPGFDGPQLVGYRVEKSDGTVYDVGVMEAEPTCDCRGFERWHGERGTECKPLQALRLLVG